MKIIRENIFEKFEEDSDPIKDMGIGDKKINISIRFNGGDKQKQFAFEKKFNIKHFMSNYIETEVLIYQIPEILRYLINICNFNKTSSLKFWDVE